MPTAPFDELVNRYRLPVPGDVLADLRLAHEQFEDVIEQGQEMHRTLDRVLGSMIRHLDEDDRSAFIDEFSEA